MSSLTDHCISISIVTFTTNKTEVMKDGHTKHFKVPKTKKVSNLFIDMCYYLEFCISYTKHLTVSDIGEH
jgi:hypothetical protein